MIFVNIAFQDDYQPSKTDYYESFQNRDHCIIFSNDLPSSPPILFATVEYQLYSFIFGFSSKNASINIGLKKIDKKCENSLIFSILRDDFRKLEFKIYLSLIDNGGDITSFEYIVYKGISTGNHKLWDYDLHFSLDVKFIRSMEEYIIYEEMDADNYEHFLPLISNESKEICVLTEKNEIIVLKPEWENYKPDGYLTGITAKFTLMNQYVGALHYTAFSCDKNEYENENVRIIRDQPEILIRLYGNFWKLYDGMKFIEEHEFQLSNVTIDFINDMNVIQHEYKKLFLIKTTKNLIRCPDNTLREIYISNNNIRYYIKELKKIKVSPNMEQKRHVDHSTTNPCDL